VKQTPLRPGKPPRRQAPLRRRFRRQIDRQASEAWARGIRAKTCAVCGKRCGTVQGHHVLYQQWLRQVARERGLEFEQLRWDKRNRLPVGERCHGAHHSARRRITRDVLRRHAPKVFQMARELGLTGRLEATYPENDEEGSSP
jgi:hypothetical protein